MLRRTVFAAIGVGVAAFVVLAVVGQPIAGLGVCVGLAAGLVNMRLVMKTASRLNAIGDEKVRRPMAMNTMGRLGIITVVAIAFAFLSVPLAMGFLGGVAFFSFLFLISLARTLFHTGAVA